MRLAVTGSPVKKRASKSLGEAQLRILAELHRETGLLLAQIRLRIGDTRVDYTERSMHGLIKRGYLRWEIDETTALRYFITAEGRKKLSSSSG